jgi:microtubule-associated protein-like 6
MAINMGISESSELRAGIKSLSLSGELVSRLLDRFNHMSDTLGLSSDEVKLLYRAKPEQLDLIFQTFDVSKRGKIDAFEFIAAMILLSEASLKAKAQILFDLYDFDHSKSLTFDELVIMSRAAVNALSHMTNSSPISTDDLVAHCQKLFEKIDTNKDKNISLSEWKSFVTRDVELVKTLERLQLITAEDKRPNFGPEDDPGMDSDFENETFNKAWDRSEVHERVKNGVESVEDQFLIEEVGEGDQFLAVKPWEGVVKNSVPSHYQPKPGESNPPDASLQLEYIHGYRCHDVRNNLRFNASGEVVYHTAAVGVSLSLENHQKHFLAHTDDITAFDVSPDGRMAVSGEVGKTPSIHVWDCISMEPIRTFKGIIKRGVSNLAFSSDGSRIVALAADEDHTLAVYDVNNAGSKTGAMQYLVATGKAGKDTFLDVRFFPGSNERLALCGVKVFATVTIKGNGFVVKKGTGWGKSQLTQLQTLSCIGFMGNTVLTGAFNGAIFRWEEGILKDAVKVHCSSISCFGISPEGIVSGGNDGFVVVLNSNLETLRTVNLKNMESQNPKVRSVVQGPAGLLIGSRGGEIFLVNGGETRRLMSGHFDNELWGLASSPNSREFATFGQDNLLAIWDLDSHRQLRSVKIESPGETISYSPCGSNLAVGLQNGKVQIIDSSTLTVKVTKHDRKKAVSQVKFSPDGKWLACGGHDSLIIVYSTESFSLKYKLKGHSASILHLDFSVNSEVLQSTSLSYELLYHNLNTGLHDPKGASGNRDEPWNTWTCTLGWPVQGIWPPCSDGSDINSVRRSLSGRVLATTDDFSQVKLFKFPCPVKNAGCCTYRGHSSHVTNSAFFNNYLITTGGNDKSVFQWKFFEEEEQPDIDHEGLGALESEASLFKFETVGEGDQFLAVKPWLGEMKASTPKIVLPKGHSKAPESGLSLSRVHGYRGYDSRNNLKFTSNNRLAFPAAGLAIVQDIDSLSQEFFTMHDDDVVSLSLHPNKKFIATGQTAHVGKSTKIDLFVWDSETMQNLACLSGFHRRAIRHLDFSPNGSLLLSIGDDDDHSLAVYDWSNSRTVCNSKVDKDSVLGASFISNNELAVYGAKFVKFFVISGTNVSSNRGITGGAPFEGQMSGIVFNGKFHTGTHAGNLFQWDQKALQKSISVHTGQLWALSLNQSNLITGGSEGLIFELDSNYSKLRTFDLTLHSTNPGVRALDVKDGQIAAGTRGCEVFVINDQETRLVQQGHSDGELWGLAVHPSGLEFVTCGGDKTLRLWDLNSGKQVKTTGILPVDLRAVDWAPNGAFIAAGNTNASISLFSNELVLLHQLASSFKGKDCWIEDLKFSPDSSKLAFGAHGCASKVEVFAVESGKLIKHCIINAGLTSALTHLDWSVDGSTLIVNSEAYELKFVSVDQKKNVPSSSMKDAQWFSHTCPFAWSVQYIWPECADGSDINSVHKAKNANLLVTADDFGKLNLFKWPVAVEHQASKSYSGHSAHVTKVKFTHDDQFVVSIGGDDKCAFVWKTEIQEDAHDEEVSIEVERVEVKKVDEKKAQRRETATRATLPKVKVVNTRTVAAEESKAPQKKENAKKEERVKGKSTKNVSEGAMKAPTGFLKPSRNANLPPAVNLQLEFVHGYRAKDCRNNIRYLPDDRIAYNAAALGVVLNPEDLSQSFYVGHNDDITAFAVSRAGDLAATGEVGRRPSIFVWEPNSMTQLHKFASPVEKGIAALSFSPSGQLLLAVGMDDDHTLALYNLATNSLIVSNKGDREKILAADFISETEFVTIGIKHFKSWKLSGSKLVGNRGTFGKEDNILLSLTMDQNFGLLTGTSAGTVLRWVDGEAKKVAELHSGAVDSLWACEQFLVTGGKDGVIHVLNSALEKVKSFDVKSAEYQSLNHQVRAACLNEDRTKLVLGTFASEIFEVTVETGDVKNLVRGHYAPCRGTAVTNEVWGLHVVSDNEYLTCSDDGTLRLWSLNEKKQLNLKEFGKVEGSSNSSRARCVASSDHFVAVGFLDGHVEVLNRDFSNAHLISDRKEEISDLKFSPDGSKLAVGSHDNFVDIYQTSDFKRVGVCKGHSSFITHLDWSTDSAYLHSNCGAYEILFWEANGKQVTGGATLLKDEEWNTWTCVIGWPVQGVYPPYADGTDINAVDRSKKTFGNNEYQLIAASDDFGTVRLLRYPCLDKKSEGVTGKGHCSHVTNVRFSKDDSRLITVGGDDQCVFQWTVTPKSS